MTNSTSLNRSHEIVPQAAHLAGFTDFSVSFLEANHRISNNLALLAGTLSMRASDLARSHKVMSSTDVAGVLQEVCARITTVGHLHRFLSTQPDPDRIDLAEHLHELATTLVAALAGPGQVELIETSSSGCVAWPDQVMPLSLIVTEVITNSIKYAHPAGVPGKLWVGCRAAPGGATVIEITDDGVGFPEGFDFSDAGGIGSRTIRVLARQLGATLDFRSGPIGLKCTLTIAADG